MSPLDKITIPTNKKNPFESVASEQRDCTKHGPYQSEKCFGQWTRCDACVADEAAEDRNAEQSRKQKARIDAAGIPLRFRDKGFDQYRADNEGQRLALITARAYAANFPEHRVAGRCMVLIGGVGTGKTHLALAIGREVLESGFSVLYLTVHELIETIRATWRSDSAESESTVVERMTSVDLLILDEVGVQYGKESEQIELFKVLNKRYNDMLPSIVLSNVATEDLQRYLGERALDRLRENGGRVVQFDWQSDRSSSSKNLRERA